MENDIKELGLKALLDKGDVESFLEKKIKTEESSQKGQLIGSIARIADLVTQHSEGVMVEAVTERITKALAKLTAELSDSVQKDMKDVAKDLEKFTTAQNDKAKRDIVARIETKLVEIEDSIKANSDGLLREFFDEALPDLRENARVTPDELATMERNTKEAVKQQLPRLIRGYFRDVMLSPEQIEGFSTAVKALLPKQKKFDIKKEKIDWNQIQNIPEGVTRTGGIVTKAIEWINGIDLSTAPTNGQSLTYDSTTKTWKPGSSGAGDMLIATYDAAGKSEQLLGVSDILDEDNMASNSATKVPSQQSVKAYVDAQTHSFALNDLTDVTETTVANDEVLQYTGAGWENQTLAEAGIQAVLAEGAFADGDKTKLDGIETGADVTDTANVTSAGALMDSELTDITFVKAVSDADVSTVNTGTSTTAVPTADSLAGSYAGTKSVGVQLFDGATDTATGDGKAYFMVPAELNGMNLVAIRGGVATAGTTGTTDIQVHNVTDAADMLSTKLTIDSGETTSATAATAAVINTAADDVATNDVLRFDVDAVSTTAAKGLFVTLTFRLP